jgi:thiol-disulfide isomerase/thioredoxin
VRRALGIAVLGAVIAIALGWDRGVLTQLSYASTNRVEQSLITTINPHMPAASGTLGEGELPSLSGATSWLNSAPLTPEALRGKVVVVDFWTYSCINCLRSLPFVEAWYKKYSNHGLVVIGVHSPEFAFEKNEDNVRRAVSDLGITYPVALDNDYAIWRAFNNQYWPAHYFIDATGRIRSHHFGEGDYDQSERTIRQLLTEAGYTKLPMPEIGTAAANGVQAASDLAHVQSPETYVGYRRAERFASPGGLVHDGPHSYEVPVTLTLNQWALAGSWAVDPEKAVLQAVPGKIEFRFFARDLHLVLGPGADGKPIRFRVRLDGAAPGENHGTDTDTDGSGVIREQRLYQLIRQSGEIGQHVFSIDFEDSNAQAYAFTFG